MSKDSIKSISTAAISFGLVIFSQFLIAEDITNFTPVLTIKKVERFALENEPGITSQDWQTRSLSENAIAESQLPDPKIQLGLINVPTDTFDFDQENMTQIKLGVSQQFPGGNTLDVKQKKIEKQALSIRERKEQRKLTILKTVRLTYLEIYYLEQAKITILENKKLFSQLTEIVKSLYSVGKNNQQDLIHSQLELSRLDDRIVRIDKKIKAQRYSLARWIGIENSQLRLANELPEWASIEINESVYQDEDALVKQLLKHPIIKEMDHKIEVSRQDIALVKESYKPGWGLNVSYSYREDRPDGIERSDFLTVGTSIDLPIFSAKRQDKKLLSKEYKYQSLKDKRVELLRNLISSLQQEYSNRNQIIKRNQLYKTLLLPQAKQQAEAALLAYQSDRGDFADVMRAHIDNLNALLDNMRITIDLLKTKSNILYFTSSFSNEG